MRSLRKWPRCTLKVSNHILDNPPNAIIFDLDGTLLDTEPLYSIASQRVLDPFGNTYTAELKKRSMGGDSTKSAQYVIDEFDLPLTTTEYLNRRERYLIELFADVAEIGHAGEFIDAIGASQIPIGLATSSHESLCSLKLRGKHWASAFDSVICGDHGELKRSKPEPDIFILCARELGVDPATCVAFEDSPNGVESAKRAGMRVLALLNPYVEMQDLARADMVFSSYGELLSYARHWQADPE